MTKYGLDSELPQIINLISRWQEEEKKYKATCTGFLKKSSKMLNDFLNRRFYFGVDMHVVDKFEVDLIKNHVNEIIGSPENYHPAQMINILFRINGILIRIQKGFEKDFHNNEQNVRDN